MAEGSDDRVLDQQADAGLRDAEASQRLDIAAHLLRWHKRWTPPGSAGLATQGLWEAVEAH